MPHGSGMLVAPRLAGERGRGLSSVFLAGDGVGGAASLVVTRRQAPAGAFREKCCHRNKAAGRAAGAGKEDPWPAWGPAPLPKTGKNNGVGEQNQCPRHPSSKLSAFGIPHGASGRRGTARLGAGDG